FSAGGTRIWGRGDARGGLNSYGSDILARTAKKGFAGVAKEADGKTKSLHAAKVHNTPPSSEAASLPKPPSHMSIMQERSFVPTPPSTNPQSQTRPVRVWRVPTSMKNYSDPADPDTGDAARASQSPPPSSHSLLDGPGFDAEESHQSFLEALQQWRGAASETPISKPSSPLPQSARPSSTQAAGQQTMPQTQSDIVIAFQPKQLSYFDMLKREKSRPATPSRVRTPAPIVEEEREPTEEWGDAEEAMLEEILAKTRPNRAVSSCPVPEPATGDGTVYVLEMQDITENEDDFILEALNRGEMVECIPSSKLVVVFPSE
ncbi:hypothetical protein HDV03_002573, partial [Kappamyces sp. JEL0829]